MILTRVQTLDVIPKPVPVRLVPASLFPNVFGDPNATHFAFLDQGRLHIVSARNRKEWVIPNRYLSLVLRQVCCHGWSALFPDALT